MNFFFFFSLLINGPERNTVKSKEVECDKMVEKDPVRSETVIIGEQ